MNQAPDEVFPRGCPMLSLALLLILAADVPAESGGVARLGFVGDVSFAGRSDAPAEVLAAVRETLSRPDFTVANVEGLLLDNGAPAYAEARLDISAAPRYAAAFDDSGIDLLGLANNHGWDAGARGVTENRSHLAGHGAGLFGASDAEAAAFMPSRKTSDAGCLAFIPATLKSNRAPEAGAFVAFYGRGGHELAALYDLVRETRADCAPIVFVHWGREGKPRPEADVIAVGHALVEAGAALVVGHHPHVLQGVELIATARGRAAIAWSLGNFVFRNRDPDKRRTGMLAVELRRDGQRLDVGVALVPLTIDAKTFAPRPATAPEISDHLRVMRERSAPFGTDVALDASSGRLVFSSR